MIGHLEVVRSLIAQGANKEAALKVDAVSRQTQPSNLTPSSFSPSTCTPRAVEPPSSLLPKALWRFLSCVGPCGLALVGVSMAASASCVGRAGTQASWLRGPRWCPWPCLPLVRCLCGCARVTSQQVWPRGPPGISQNLRRKISPLRCGSLGWSLCEASPRSAQHERGKVRTSVLHVENEQL